MEGSCFSELGLPSEAVFWSGLVQSSTLFVDCSESDVSSSFFASDSGLSEDEFSIPEIVGRILDLQCCHEQVFHCAFKKGGHFP